VIACQFSGVRSQVSGLRCQVITCQVLVLAIKWQRSGVKYNISVSGELNIELQHHISTHIAMYHVLKARVAIVRH